MTDQPNQWAELTTEELSIELQEILARTQLPNEINLMALAQFTINMFKGSETDPAAGIGIEVAKIFWELILDTEDKQAVRHATTKIALEGAVYHRKPF